MEFHAQMASSALDDLTAEERQRIYKMIRLKVYTYAEGGTELNGVFSLRDESYAENITPRLDARPVRSGRPPSCASKMGRT